jgi:hypothetical protein
MELPMLNVSRVLQNPHFRQTFRVYRSEGEFRLGGWVEIAQSPEYFEMSGVAWPSSAKEIQQVPEGDRIQGMHTFATIDPLYVTHASGIPGTSDQLEWNGERYRLLQILNFNDYGFNVAVGARLEGD